MHRDDCSLASLRAVCGGGVRACRLLMARWDELVCTVGERGAAVQCGRAPVTVRSSDDRRWIVMYRMDFCHLARSRTVGTARRLAGSLHRARRSGWIERSAHAHQRNAAEPLVRGCSLAVRRPEKPTLAHTRTYYFTLAAVAPTGESTAPSTPTTTTGGGSAPRCRMIDRRGLGLFLRPGRSSNETRSV